jgi:hypothetical protein
MAWVFVAQVLALVAMGWWRRHALNPDGVAYLRIAGYNAHGQTGLAVSGYWGPLLSWLMAPGLAAGMSPLVVARVVMALTAVIFLLGCVAVFRAFQLPARWQLWGAWLAAAVSVCWSVENISPDLLAAGLVGFAFSKQLEFQSAGKPPVAVWSGIGWGLAYLAKAAALPLALLVSAGMLAVQWYRGNGELKRAAPGWLMMWLCVAVMAGPWIAVISTKYHRLTISRSAELNHAMVGPADMDRFYPLDRGFYEPEPGRVTLWEDPDLPYPDWSPLASPGNALLQLKVVAHNIPVVILMLSGVSLVFLWLLVMLPVRLLRPEWRAALAGQRWPWALLPIAAMGITYLGGNLLMSEQRYFYAAFPLLFVAGVGACFSENRSGGSRGGEIPDENVPPLPVPLLHPMEEREKTSLPTALRQSRPACPGRAAMLLFAVAFLVPTLARPTVWRWAGTTAGECAWVLAQKLEAAHVAGPVAGSAPMPGGRAGLYVAFHLGQPWFGDPRQVTAENFEPSRARIIIVNRRLPIVAELGRDAHFVDLDGRLFGSAGEAAAFPLQVFELVQLGQR